MSLKHFFKRIIALGSKDEPVCEKKTLQSQEYPSEYKKVLYFNQEVKKLLSEDKYIARSNYKHIISNDETYKFFEVLNKSNLLEDYVQKNGLDRKEIDSFIQYFNEIKDIKKEAPTFRKHNDQYIKKHLVEEKTYLDNILKECDPNILLDNEQREVVLSEEDNTLVIAGAGAGKTTTVAAKVRYLVEKKNLDPKNILIISFTNKAVDELKERINNNLNIPCPITTFHSVGYTLLRKGDT